MFSFFWKMEKIIIKKERERVTENDGERRRERESEREHALVNGHRRVFNPHPSCLFTSAEKRQNRRKKKC